MSAVTDPDDDELEAAIQEKAMRAQLFARKAIIKFVESERDANPQSQGASTAIGMTLGFLMSIIEMSMAAYAVADTYELDKETFLELASRVFDDAVGDDE